MGALWTDWKKNSLWSVIFSFCMQQQWTISGLDCDVQQKVDCTWQPAMTNSVAGPRISPKVLPKAKLIPKKRQGHCSVVVYCWSDPLQLYESWQNYYIWELYSANSWDALKTAMPAVSIGQQNGPNSSLLQCLTAHHTTKASEVEQTGLQSFASSSTFTWLLTNWLTLLQVSWQLFAGKMLPHQQDAAKCFPKISSDPKA